MKIMAQGNLIQDPTPENKLFNQLYKFQKILQLPEVAYGQQLLTNNNRAFKIRATPWQDTEMSFTFCFRQKSSTQIVFQEFWHHQQKEVYKHLHASVTY